MGVGGRRGVVVLAEGDDEGRGEWEGRGGVGVGRETARAVRPRLGQRQGQGQGWVTGGSTRLEGGATCNAVVQ